MRGQRSGLRPNANGSVGLMAENKKTARSQNADNTTRVDSSNQLLEAKIGDGLVLVAERAKDVKGKTVNVQFELRIGRLSPDHVQISDTCALALLTMAKHSE